MSLSSEAAASLRIGVDARRLGCRNLRAVEPDRRFRLAALLLRQLTQDPGGVDDRSRRRARERAGEDHLRVLDRLRRKVPVGGVVEESSERERAVGLSAVRAASTALRRRLARARSAPSPRTPAVAMAPRNTARRPIECAVPPRVIPRRSLIVMLRLSGDGRHRDATRLVDRSAHDRTQSCPSVMLSARVGRARTSHCASTVRHALSLTSPHRTQRRCPAGQRCRRNRSSRTAGRRRRSGPVRPCCRPSP